MNKLTLPPDRTAKPAARASITAERSPGRGTPRIRRWSVAELVAAAITRPPDAGPHVLRPAS